MTETAGLLALMQLSDSMFPSGMFTHSLGLEQLFREGRVRCADDVERFAESVLVHSTARGDAVAAAQAVRLAQRRDLNGLVSLDCELLAMKPAAELRAASTETGRRLLEEVSVHLESVTVTAFLGLVRDGRAAGTYAVAFGVIASEFDSEPATIAAVLMLGTATAIFQAAMRLFPMSHRDVQAALHRQRPRIVELASRAAEPGRLLESFHPIQDIASMRHESAAARMFAS